MDCPSEENLIRMQLATIPEIKKMDFDIPNSNLTIYHHANDSLLLKKLKNLNLGAKFVQTETVEDKNFSSHNQQRELLWYVLLINFGFFLIEIGAGWLSNSMGLVADSLDMLADSFVYGLSLLAIGATVMFQKKVAKIAGFIQILLAVLGFIEVIRRFLNPDNIPDFKTMIVVSFFALLANAYCLFLLQKSKSKEAHIQASMLFTSNDIIINVGVIIAGILVHFTQNTLPDLIIGTIVFALVLQGAYRILKIAK